MQNFAPIALFVYNRPQHTRRTINFLKQNLLADESRLYIFSDAAKTTKEENDVLEVRNMIKEVDGFKSVKIVERNSNFGLANSIVSGVSQLVKDYGKVIVFEDDLLSSPYTLQYFNEALQKYQNEDKVMHISAYMYPLKEANKLPETFLYRAAHSWGWATWEKSWQHFNPNIDALLEKFDTKRKHEFSIEGTMNFWKQMQDFKNKKNNSWAIRWYASIFLMNGLCLNPSKSLIHNIGHDGSGIHSNIEKTYAVNIHKNPITQFPTIIEESKQAYQFIKHFLSKRKGNIFKRIVKYISTSISKLR